MHFLQTTEIKIVRNSYSVEFWSGDAFSYGRMVDSEIHLPNPLSSLASENFGDASPKNILL